MLSNQLYSIPGMKAENLKYVSLVTLTVQNALLGLSMRYSRTRTGDMFYSSTGIINRILYVS